MARPSSEAIYVVRVVSRGGAGEGTLPSERRYSATTVGGIALVHFALSATLMLLFALHAAFTPPADEAKAEDYEAELSQLATLSSYSWAVASFCILLGPTVTGILSWKRWYVESNLRRFLAASGVALVAAVASTALTSAAIILIPKPRGGHVVDAGAERNAAMLSSIALNAAVASALEVLACLASLKVAWSGINRKEGEEDTGTGKKDPERVQAPEGPLPRTVPAPDIVPCESSREYEERMRRFVADGGRVVVDPVETIGR
ncbi:uncharacterized protein LOC124169322 [Ischnura elegans]|uniref:uncharacterized protein LOC124169322 n=1 Tax=Ischnura elegans TaxID=197161 RepID=UPI001ED86E1E|nr:uncharacterized protein LOC124169322 [Ischnura elegans]